MANKTGHRRFGSVRRRRLGRWQARYQGPDGLTRSAPRTFDSKRSAEQWLTLMEGRILRGEWQPPEQSKIMFGGYATHWVADRRLEPRSRELYAMLLRLHIMPWFGGLALDRMTPPIVRLWRTDLLRRGRSESTAVKSYRLLRAILNTAVKDDRLLRENPCRMRWVRQGADIGAADGISRSGVAASCADTTSVQALVISAAFTGLRWSDLVAVRVRDVDLDTGVVQVGESSLNCRTADGVSGRPKSDAGFRSGLALSAGSGGARAPGRVPPERSEGPDLQRAEGGGVAARQLPSISALARMRGRGRTPAGLPVSTICATQATRWRPCRGEHTGADASDGAREYARRIDLSARHQQAGSRDCGCD
jgi:hypothetical protein